jgi:predicted ATPase
MRYGDLVLSRIDIGNFKSIQSASLHLRQLTVLVGENSAGKSSVLQTVFLLSQIARGRTRPDVVSLNGMEISVGNFSDVLYSGAPGETIEIGLTVPTFGGLLRRRALSNRFRQPGRSRSYMVQGEEDRSEASWALTLAEPATQLGVAEILRVRVQNSRDGVELTVEPNEDRLQIDEIYEHSRRLGLIRGVPSGRIRLSHDEVGATRFRGRVHVEGNGAAFDETDEELPAVAVENGFPMELYSYVNESLALAQRWVELVTRRTRQEAPRLRGTSDRDFRRRRRTGAFMAMDPASVAEQLFPGFRRWVEDFDRSADATAVSQDVMVIEEAQFEAIAGVEEDVALALADLLESSRPEQGAIATRSSSTVEISAAIRALLYDAVHYLGPLREDPSPSYRPGQSGGVATLGIKGEYSVAALDMYGSQRANYPLPDGVTRYVTLGEAINRWAQRFNFAREVRTHDKGRLGIELELIDPQTGESRDLTSVGVGVSQLLPVVLICLLAQPGELVLLEQPELHLHPGPQQILGDFLLAVIESGRQVIVETHSEYLINRLRLRIAEDEYGAVSDSVRIWYAKRRDGRTSFESLEPNRYGSFEQWPDGFFDQAPREAEQILRAAARKRRSQPSAIAEAEERSEGVPVHVDYQGRRIDALFDSVTERVTILSEPFKGRSFRSPSGAAIEVVRLLNPNVTPNRNGWGFWVVSDTGELLQSIRHRG